MRRKRVIRLVLAATIILALITAFIARARVLMERHICGSLMISICFEAQTWSEEEDHNGLFPNDFLSMSNELPTMFLICPSDPSRHRAESFSSFTPDNCSYEIVTKGLKAGDAHGVFLRCKIHGFLGYADGSVYDNYGRRMKKW